MPLFETTPVCVRIDPALRAALNDAAHRQGKSNSEVLRSALTEHLHNEAGREAIFARIVAERARQEVLHPNRTCAHPILAEHKVVVLAEEVGEVARSILDGEPKEMLVEELTQVAAIAVAWLEHLLGTKT